MRGFPRGLPMALPRGLVPAFAPVFGGAVSMGIDALSINTEQATPEQIGLYLPTSRAVAAGSVSVQYRRTGDVTWIDAHPLLRIQGTAVGGPSTLVDSFAGTIFDLSPGTQYDLQITHVESGQPNKQTTIQSTTRALPATAGAPNKNATVGGTALQTLFNGLVAGDVLQLANGTYAVSSLTLSNSGTSGSPIYIRGASQSGVTIQDTTGVVLTINASHVVLENLTIQGSGVDSGVNSSSQGIRNGNSSTFTNLTVRNVSFAGVDMGIASDTGQIGTLIYNCTLNGNNVWADVANNSSWNDDGIRIPGQGCCAWNNSISGFGDACAWVSGALNIGSHFYRNRITFTDDDPIEGDYAVRNCSFYDNAVTNSATAVSLDPLYGGPFYAFRNTFINTYRHPYKLNSDESGFLFYNNTIVRTTGWSFNWAWVQFDNGQLGNLSYRNNLLIYRGTTSGGGTFDIDAPVGQPLDFSNNGWFPNSNFVWTAEGKSFGNLAAAQAAAGSGGLANITPLFGSSNRRHAGDVVTASNPFTQTLTLGADYTTQYSGSIDVSLAAGAAKNAGVAIPGITDGFSGAAPDMGSNIAGRAQPSYGPTPAWMSGLAVLTWKTLPNTSMTSAGADSAITAYSGAALKQSNSELIVFGGGHFDSSDNSVNSIVLSADVPVSTQRVAATPSGQRTSNVPYYADGKPSARHSWGDLAVDESVNRFITMQCSNPSGDSGSWSPKRDGLNLATYTWLAAGTYDDGPIIAYTPATSCTKDAAGNIYWWNENNGGIYKIAPGSVAMATTAAVTISGTYNICLACDTVRNRLVTFNAAVESYSYDLNNNFARTAITFSGANSAAANDSSYWAYCPERDSFLGIRYTGGSVVVYECNASTFAVTTLSVSGTAPAMPSDGNNNCYGRWGYAPQLMGFYLLPDGSSNVSFFRTA